MKNNILKSISVYATRALLKVDKHKPEILLFAGLIGAATSTVLACIATTKINDILAEPKDTLEAIHKGMEDGSVNGQEYTKEDGQKDIVIVYAQTAVKVVKLYAPAAIVGVLSMASILTSNNIIRERNAALLAAYAALDKSYKEYRGRVVESIGEEAENDLMCGTKVKKIEETEIDPETGKEKKVKKTIKVADPNLTSPYAVYFDKQNSKSWDRNMDMNWLTIRAVESYANDRLNASEKDVLFWNDVRADLGMQPVRSGQFVGWTRNNGDGKVNFRAREVWRETEDGGHERVIVLDPNIEGEIWQKI